MEKNKYIYEVVARQDNSGDALEKILNKHQDKLIANIIELDTCFVIIWDK